MKKIILSMLPALLIGLLWCPGKSAWALDKINVTLPSKSFQFIIFPLAKERGYMKEEGIDLNVVVMASTPGLQAVLAGEMDFTGSGSRPWSPSPKAMRRLKPFWRHRSGAAVANGPAPV